MNSIELKEAIAEYIKSKELVLMGYSPEYIDDVKTDMEIAFRAGAEWMAEQEQPEPAEQSEENETIDQLAEEYVEGVKKFNDAPTWDLIHTAVCYGYELSFNARKEEGK